MVEDFQAHDGFCVKRITHEPIQGKESFLLRAFLRAHGIKVLATLHFREGSLSINMGRHRDAVEMGKVFPVEIGQLFLDIHVPVKVNIAVGRVIILAMEIPEHLLGKLWNMFRITA